MLYANYLRNKMRHLVKTLFASGYPLKIISKFEKKAFNYTIHGRTGTGKNLIPYPYRNKTITTGGITFTDNGDGTITANGTATANALFPFDLSAEILTKDVYCLSGCPKQTSTKNEYYINISVYNESTYTTGAVDVGNTGKLDLSTKDFTRFNAYIIIMSGTTVENLVFKPMLELGSTSTEYVAYTNGVGDMDSESGKYKIALKNTGRNSIIYPYAVNMSKTTYGITFVDNGHGVVTANGTATSNISLVINTKNLPLEVGEKYILSGCPNGGSANTYRIFSYLYKNGATTATSNIAETGDGVIIDTAQTGYDAMRMYIRIMKGVVCDNFVFKPMLSKCNTGENLIPYPYYSTSKTVSGITFTDNGDRTMTANGTATAAIDYVLCRDFKDIDKTKKYVMSGGADNISVYMALYQNDTLKKEIRTPIIDFSGYSDVEYNRIVIGLSVSKSAVLDNVTIKPVIEPGDTILEYEPYRAAQATTIYRAAPLKSGESISCKADNLPDLQLYEGENNITADTEIKPSAINVKYLN